MDVKRPRTEWIPQSGRHAAICNAVEFQFRLTRDHGIGRRPARPFPPVGHDSLSRPGKPFTSDPLGSASCRDIVCPYVSLSVVAVSFKKHQTTPHTTYLTIPPS